MKLLLGDCFDKFKTIGNKSIDIAFTSPPYNRKRNDKYANYNDQIADYYGFCKKAIEELRRIVNGYVIFNLQANYYNRADVYRLVGEYAESIVNIIIWEKSNPLPASGYNITNAYEFFLILSDSPLKSNTTYTKNHITTSVNSDTTTKIHKAVMKQEVSDWFIEKFTQKGMTVIDPFMGLGTTGISCKKLHRDFIGIEKDAKYYEIAKERIDANKTDCDCEIKSEV